MARGDKSSLAAAFSAVLAEYEITESEAARLLDVHRQSFNNYKQGKTSPHRHVLAKAIELWEPLMAKHGFARGAVLAKKCESGQTEPYQLALFSEELQGQFCAVRIESKSEKHLHLVLNLKIA